MDKVIRAAVVGHPVAHSISPEIFKHFAKASGTRIQYQKWDIDPSRFDRQFKEKIRAAGTEWIGCNVTLPYKERVLKIVDRSKADGAVNVIKKTATGLVGYNTDTLGIEKTLKKNKVKVGGKIILVIGAGGAARALCLVMKQLNAREVHILNRSVKKSRKLVSEMNSKRRTRFKVIKKINLDVSYYLVVNATPQGMKGRPKLQYPEFKKPSRFAFDMVYRPMMTDFLKSAKKAGAYPIGGLDMLVWQAWATWEIWFGKPPVHPSKIYAIGQKLRRFL
jgi:shikimate dehydrogenase